MEGPGCGGWVWRSRFNFLRPVARQRNTYHSTVDQIRGQRMPESAEQRDREGRAPRPAVLEVQLRAAQEVSRAVQQGEQATMPEPLCLRLTEPFRTDAAMRVFPPTEPLMFVPKVAAIPEPAVAQQVAPEA